MIKRKKARHKNAIIEKMNIETTDGKDFWKLLDKLDDSKTNPEQFKNTISGEKWVNHFKKILNNNERPPLQSIGEEFGPLDYEITNKEMEEAAYILRPGKAPGIDSISNEMISCLLEQNSNVLLKLFNSILKNSYKKTNVWDISLINPIHKKGSFMEVENYRGISLLSCLGKFFSAILLKRLQLYVKENNILSEEQLGFRTGNRTSDAHLILHNIVNQYCHKNGKKVHGCFVDFQRAFDSIPREVLFQKLYNYGIKGKFYQTLENMYSNDKGCIKIGGYITNLFEINLGVKQGCILSPILFNIFLADLTNTLDKESNTPVKISEEKQVSSLIWADDLLMLSETETGLNNMLQDLKTYAEDNGLTINTDKTQCMIFNKTGRLLRRNFAYGHQNIKTVRTYKYLGFIVTPSGEIKTGLDDLKDRALKAIYKIKMKMGRYFQKYVKTTLKLFDTLVTPILLYASDFWGCLKQPINNPIENTHNRFLKELIGVQRQTSNTGVLLETGRVPMHLLAKKYCLKNWVRIAKSRSANYLLTLSYDNSLKHNLTWPTSVKNIFSKVGQFDLFLTNEISRKPPNEQFFKRACDIFHQESFAEIHREESKLRTFAKLKSKIGMENYLLDISNIEDRISLTKIRLSNHKLNIEVGRHNKIQKSERFCPFCPTLIEDEMHFLLLCPTYSTNRTELFEELNITNIQNIDQESLFVFLMTSSDTTHITARFLKTAIHIREFLVKKFRNDL